MSEKFSSSYEKVDKILSPEEKYEIEKSDILIDSSDKRRQLKQEL
jgi:hypothetical protein